MNYTVCIPTQWGIDGLESCQELVSFEDRSLAWEFVKQYYEDHGTDEVLMVRKSDFSECEAGYPTPWDDEP